MNFEDVTNSSSKNTDAAEVSSRLFACSYGDEQDGRKASPVFAETPSEKPAEKRVAEESKETPEQRTDQKLKEHFGPDILDHAKDHDWLIDNREKLEKGFKNLNGQDAWAMAQRLQELSKVDGKSLIYLSRTEGQTAGSLLQKRYDIYLRRGSLRSDNRIGQLYH